MASTLLNGLVDVFYLKDVIFFYLKTRSTPPKTAPKWDGGGPSISMDPKRIYSARNVS